MGIVETEKILSCQLCIIASYFLDSCIFGNLSRSYEVCHEVGRYETEWVYHAPYSYHTKQAPFIFNM